MQFLIKLYGYLYFQSWRHGLWRPPDRLMLEKQIFSELSHDPNVKSVLFVGVHSYTAHYPAFFPRQRFVTIDRDPAVAKFGSTAHIVGEIQNASRFWQEGDFDVVILNGVFGYGVNHLEQVDIVLAQIAKLLRPSGRLLLGFNPLLRTHPQLADSAVLAKEFEPTSLRSLSGHTQSVVLPLLKDGRHDYAVFRRKEGPVL